MTATRTRKTTTTATKTVTKRPVGRPRKDGTPAGSPRGAAAKPATAKKVSPAKSKPQSADGDKLLNAKETAEFKKMADEIVAGIREGLFDSVLSALTLAVDERLVSYEAAKVKQVPKPAKKTAASVAEKKLPASPIKRAAAKKPAKIETGKVYMIATRDGKLDDATVKYLGSKRGDTSMAKVEMVKGIAGQPKGTVFFAPKSAIREVPEKTPARRRIVKK